MQEALLFVLFGAVFVTLYFAAMAYAVRLQKGRFEIRHHGSDGVSILTDVGRFTLHPRATLQVSGLRGANQTLKLDDIRSLRFSHAEKAAILAETFWGFDAWDISGQWLDGMNWYSISLVTATGDVPLYLVGQLERREPFAAWWFDFVNNMLEKLRLYEDVDERARRVLDEVLRVFRDAGKSLPLA